MARYRYHVFFCTNQREDGASCCGEAGASGLRDYLKRQSKELGLSGPGGVRVNAAGCLGRCGDGPVMVVYPDATWYTYTDKTDLEEILREHLTHGRVVERLVLVD